jgi:hypothetical protein
MPQKDYDTGKMDHSDEVFQIVFPAYYYAAEVLEPGEQTFAWRVSAVSIRAGMTAFTVM